MRDGANQALNRLVGYLLRQGVKVRIYSPTVKKPAFPATGDLVSIPAIPIPGRSEYRLPLGFRRAVRRDLAEFNPNVVHVSSPDIVGHRAVTWARRRQDRGGRVGPHALRHLSRLLPPAGARAAGARHHAPLLPPLRSGDGAAEFDRRDPSRAADEPRHRDLGARASTASSSTPSAATWRGAARSASRDDEMVIAFLGRIVMEKGLDVFADAIHAFAERGLKHRVLVIGEGPARPWFEEQLPEAIFTGQLTGNDLARALASADLFLNPSITEAFGNVTLEAMACGLPVVAAEATGATNLVRDGVTGTLVDGADADEFADALEAYARDPDLRRAPWRGRASPSPRRWTGTRSTRP